MEGEFASGCRGDSRLVRLGSLRSSTDDLMSGEAFFYVRPVDYCATHDVAVPVFFSRSFDCPSASAASARAVDR